MLDQTSKASILPAYLPLYRHMKFTQNTPGKKPLNPLLRVVPNYVQLPVKLQ